MKELIPAINVEKFEDVVSRIRSVEHYVKRVHIDVSDGTFTNRVVWNTADDLGEFESNVSIEVHLMVENPEEKILDWLIPEVDLIIFHIETTDNPMGLVHLCRDVDKQVGISLVPDTPWETVVPYLEEVNLIQTLAVPPGPSGQQFDERIYEKLNALRKKSPHLLLEVDGGIRVGIAKKCVEAGANMLVAGSGIFDAGMPIQDAISALQNDMAT